jgi:hypothetical protein
LLQPNDGVLQPRGVASRRQLYSRGKEEGAVGHRAEIGSACAGMAIPMQAQPQPDGSSGAM